MTHTPEEQAFAAICYHVLMTREPFTEQSPEYLYEKLDLLRMGPDAFSMLDYGNQQRCLAYCARWAFALPESVESYWRETQQLLAATFGGTVETESD
jgi:hypothetical protein